MPMPSASEPSHVTWDVLGKGAGSWRYSQPISFACSRKLLLTGTLRPLRSTSSMRAPSRSLEAESAGQDLL
jgi:hypothetical protein